MSNTKKRNKYDYYRVIQGDYGYGWDDEDFHACDSTGFIKGKTERKLFKDNLLDSRVNGGGSYRVITRRELRDDGK